MAGETPRSLLSSALMFLTRGEVVDFSSPCSFQELSRDLRERLPFFSTLHWSFRCTTCCLPSTDVNLTPTFARTVVSLHSYAPGPQSVC